MALLDQLSTATLACLEEMIARRLLDDETVLPDDGARRSSALYELAKLQTARLALRTNKDAKLPRQAVSHKLRRGLRPPLAASESASRVKSAR